MFSSIGLIVFPNAIGTKKVFPDLHPTDQPKRKCFTSKKIVFQQSHYIVKEKKNQIFVTNRLKKPNSAGNCSDSVPDGTSKLVLGASEFFAISEYQSPRWSKNVNSPFKQKKISLKIKFRISNEEKHCRHITHLPGPFAKRKDTSCLIEK